MKAFVWRLVELLELSLLVSRYQQHLSVFFGRKNGTLETRKEPVTLRLSIQGSSEVLRLLFVTRISRIVDIESRHLVASTQTGHGSPLDIRGYPQRELLI